MFEHSLKKHDSKELKGRFSLQMLLEEIQKKTYRPTELSGLLKEFSFLIKDLQPYMHFSQTSYTRNLIFSDEQLEIMLICWPPESLTKIHDHPYSHAWVLGLLGQVDEMTYQISTPSSYPQLKRTQTITAGRLSYLNDQMGVHQLSTKGRSSDAVTLHCYSPPILSCYHYDSESSQRKKAHMSFYSEYGRVNSP